jgi:hypothetical protein
MGAMGSGCLKKKAHLSKALVSFCHCRLTPDLQRHPCGSVYACAGWYV